MRNIFKLSIWAPGAIPADEWKYRNLKRVMFPVIDVFFFLGGLSAAYYGVPAISEFFPRLVVDSFSTLLSVSALTAFVGVAFPRLWLWEMVAKSIMFGLMVGYTVSLFILTSVGEGNRGFVLTVACIATAPIVWRLSLLGSEWQARHSEEKHTKEALTKSQELPYVE